MANVRRQQVRVEDKSGSGDQVVGVVGPAVGTPVPAGQLTGGAGDAFIDGGPAEGRKELLQGAHLPFSHTGKELEADNLARDHWFFFVNEAPKKIDRRLGTAQMIYGDTRVQQLHSRTLSLQALVQVATK
jgi:hypothetical protein